MFETRYTMIIHVQLRFEFHSYQIQTASKWGPFQQWPLRYRQIEVSGLTFNSLTNASDSRSLFTA
jgi:hypothetical protein